MPKYLLIKTTNRMYDDKWESFIENKFFDSEEDLISHMETWGSDIKDPIIFELAGKVNLVKKLTISKQK